jgi:dihydrofolate reductase
MSTVVFDISMSLDGFITASDQTMAEPMGVGGERLHAWLTDGDERDLDVLETGVGSAGAVITGRRNFEHALPWWGADGPTGAARLPVFVVCGDVPGDVPRDSVYVFVTDGIENAVQQAADAAGDRVVCIMGGAETARSCLAAGLVDELSIHLVPVLFGSGTSLFEGLDLGEHVTLDHLAADQTQAATHLRYRVVR